MKKIYIWMLSAIMAFDLAACSGEQKELTQVNQVVDLKTGKFWLDENQKKAVVEKY